MPRSVLFFFDPYKKILDDVLVVLLFAVDFSR